MVDQHRRSLECARLLALTSVSGRRDQRSCHGCQSLELLVVHSRSLLTLSLLPWWVAGKLYPKLLSLLPVSVKHCDRSSCSVLMATSQQANKKTATYNQAIFPARKRANGSPRAPLSQ